MARAFFNVEFCRKYVWLVCIAKEAQNSQNGGQESVLVVGVRNTKCLS